MLRKRARSRVPLLSILKQCIKKETFNELLDNKYVVRNSFLEHTLDQIYSGFARVIG